MALPSMHLWLSAGRAAEAVEGRRPCNAAPDTAVPGQAARLAPSPVPLWAVTITAMKCPLPCHPCPGSSVLSAAQPCHPAKANHSTRHPPCVKRSGWEQGFCLESNSTYTARRRHAQDNTHLVRVPILPALPAVGHRGLSPTLRWEQTGREQDSHQSPRHLSLWEGTTHFDHGQALPCLGATLVVTLGCS